jgi:hypothetical protein
MTIWGTELGTSLKHGDIFRRLWAGLLPVFGWNTQISSGDVIALLEAQILADWFIRVVKFDRMGSQLSLSVAEGRIVQDWVLGQSEVVQKRGQYAQMQLSAAFRMFAEDSASAYDLCRRSSEVMGTPFHAAKCGNTAELFESISI